MKKLPNSFKSGIVLMSLFLFFALLLSSCFSTRGTSLEVLVPAEISLPQHVKKVAVANRSLPAKGEGWLNFLEGFVTGETIRGDREGSNNCVNGLIKKLNDSPRFGAVLATSSELKGTGTREWPDVLNWTIVDSICRLYNADALILLETFDSDVYFNTDKMSYVVKTKTKKDSIVTDFVSDLKINVNAGWRMYDNIDKKLIDQNSFVDEKAWRTTAKTPQDAMAQLPNKRNALNASGIYAGNMFGIRISPSWAYVHRSYFVKGKKDVRFKLAKKLINDDDWEKATAMWSDISQSTDPVNAGRAYYNLALASEMKGDLQQALTYAKKSLEDYKIKEARYYINSLNVRIMDQEKLKEQMGK